METEAVSTAAPASAPPPITTPLRTISVPAIGTHWLEQGGIFAGLVKAGDGDRALIIAVDTRAHFEDREWGEYGKDVEFAKSYFDGRMNTRAMADAGSALAKDIVALDVAGFNDWYLPSQGELQLARANASQHFDKGDWYWTSTQCAPYHAWVQDFEDGGSTVRSKRLELRAVAVRSFIL